MHYQKLTALIIPFALSLMTVAAQTYIPVKNDSRFKIKPAADVQAYGFAMTDVKLAPGSPFAHAQQLDAHYLLELKPDRLLARFYKNAGLPEKDSVYGGWESSGLSGHTLGHYLSATSLMYSTTGNTVFKQRVDYIVGELARCQKARKTGYVGAIPNEDSIFGRVAKGDIQSGGFDLNGGWSPWYTVHKVMAGLVDAYLYTGNQEALTVVTKMADWADNLLKPLSDAQMQKMLVCEYGGMNDVLVNIYAITGNKKYLNLANRFFDDFVMLPLSERKDALQNKHANTNIPKGVGSASQYLWVGSGRDSTIAQFMWRTIVGHHSYANGGDGSYEYFGTEDHLSDRLSDDNTETCASYNMLKLTRKLFTLHPSAKLGDYYERTLTDHILATQQPETGMFTYFVPLRMGEPRLSVIPSIPLPVVWARVWKIMLNMERAYFSRVRTAKLCL
ncbi:beta-L-arabinofuranosidase domain-containing protein [Arachidicoccus ginsenosidivorans]|uniref:beta-L-arabinofuranosidase domain-containing protein n=1 Tax=Arachidicoccus ginsenosidivorans TaxID=496057 RepID=UPI0037432EDB